jgi:hypothetical protein
MIINRNHLDNNLYYRRLDMPNWYFLTMADIEWMSSPSSKEIASFI